MALTVLSCFVFIIIACHWQLLVAHDCAAFNSFDVCQDPVHSKTSLQDEIKTGATCKTTRPLLKEIKRSIRNPVKRMKILIEEFAHEHDITASASNDVTTMMFENITHSQIDSKHPVTRVYVRLNSLIHAYDFFKCQLSNIQEQCHCIKFPDLKFQRLETRFVGKWYILQDKCGSQVDKDHCTVRIDIPLSDVTTCRKLRDVIYSFMRYTLIVLQDTTESVSKIKKLLRKGKKNQRF